jgi:hypothetical protein
MQPFTRVVRWGSVLARWTRWLFVVLFGRWEWHSPAWMTWIGERSRRGWRYITATRARTALAALTTLGVAGAMVWYLTRPEPHNVATTRR